MNAPISSIAARARRRRRAGRQLLAARRTSRRHHAPAAAAAELPGSLASTPYARFLDPHRCRRRHHRLHRQGRARPGHQDRAAADRGRGAGRALRPHQLVTADTALTPNEGYTAGSQSMQNSGTAIRNAAAQVREILIEQAAKRLRSAARTLQAENGAVIAPDGQASAYGELVAADMLHVQAQPTSTAEGAGDLHAHRHSRCRASTFRPR